MSQVIPIYLVRRITHDNQNSCFLGAKPCPGYQCFSIRVILPPLGHWAISGAIFVCHNRGEAFLASGGLRPAMMQTSHNAQDAPVTQQGIIQKKTSIVPRWRNSPLIKGLVVRTEQLGKGYRCT